MQNGNRGPGSPAGRRRAFRPTEQQLEARRLMAVVDVGAIQTANLGVEAVGKSSGNTAGNKVTDVGDVTGSGYDSFVVSAPGLPATAVGGTSDFAAATESAAYLVFGSKQVNSTTITDFLNLTPVQRAADLGQLGTTGTAAVGAQLNPTVISRPPPPPRSPASTTTA